jgi:hypothetical protein
MSKLITKSLITVVSLATVVSLSGAAGLVPTVNAAALTSSQVSAIVSLLQSFGADSATIANVQASLTGSPVVATSGASASSSSVPASLLSSSDLTVGSTGAAVKDLQKFLNANGFAVAASGVGSLGNESTYFGNATKAALAKWQAAMGITPASGYFGAKSRAKLSSMGVAASTGTTTTTTSTGTTVTVPSGSGLSVSVASNNPVSGNFPAGASQIPFLNLNFAAGSSDVTVTAMNVYRGGLSSDNDINNVYLMDGSKVLATNLGLANGKATFSMPAGLFTVKAGTTKVVTVAADVSTSNTASHTFSWNVNAASDITASATVSGNFPILSNVMTAVSVSNPALATLALNNIATGGQVNAGITNFLAGEFSMQANNSAVLVKSIKLTETGTINSASDLSNIKLMNGSVQVGATMPSLNADGTVVFDLSGAPLQIPSGQTVNLMVYANIVGGVSRNFQFTIQRSYDVVSTRSAYNVGASSTGTFPISGSLVSVSQGTLTVSKDANSPANYVVPGSTNQTLASFDFAAAGEAVRMTQLSFSVTGYAASSSLVWTNLKVVDDLGVQIGNLVSSDSGTGSYALQMTNLNYIISAGQTRVLSVKADIASGFAGSIQANLTGGAAQGYTSLASVTIPSQNGNPLSAGSASFAAAINNSVGSITTVTGASSVKVASFVLSAGAAEGANLIGVTLTTNASNVAGKFQNLKVLDHNSNVQLGYTQPTLANNNAYVFTASNPIAIVAGGSEIVDVYADTVAGQTVSSMPVVSLTAASAIGATSNANKTLAAGNSNTAGQLVTVSSSGTLSAARSSNDPSSQQVSMGLSGITLGSFQLTASNSEDISLTNVTVTPSVTTNASDLQNIRLVWNGNAGTPIASVAGLSGTSTSILFSLASNAAVIPQNGNATLSVVADINSDSNATAGDAINVTLNGLTYSGVASRASTSTVAGLPITGGATYTIYRTSLNVVAGPAVSVASLGGSAGSPIAEFVFSAGSNYDANLKTVTLSTSGGLLQASTTQVLGLYDSAAPSVVLATSTATSTNNMVFTLNAGNTPTGFVISKGSSKTLLVKPVQNPTNLVVLSSGTASYQVSLQNFTWYDGNLSNPNLSIAPNQTIGLPLNAVSFSTSN